MNNNQNALQYFKQTDTLLEIIANSDRRQGLEFDCNQKDKCGHRRNVILGIIKAHYNIVKTRPSNVNSLNINVIAMGPLMHNQYIS